jgi:colicin import membrane protein
MRRSVWIITLSLVFAATGCSRQPKTAAAAPAAAASAPAPAASTMPLSPAPETAPAPPAAADLPPPPPPPPPLPREQAVRYSPADYGARERRLAALIANAETRDTSGETQARAGEGRAQRERCATRACIERSYAAEEIWLRRWEGSSDVN